MTEEMSEEIELIKARRSSEDDTEKSEAEKNKAKRRERRKNVKSAPTFAVRCKCVPPMIPAASVAMETRNC